MPGNPVEYVASLSNEGEIPVNYYKHWEQLILCQPGSPPVTLLIL